MHRIISLFAFVVVLTLCIAPASAQDLSYTTDSLEVMRKNLSEGKAVLVDVRTPAEWARGHVEGALHIPLAQIVEGKDLDRLPKDKIVYTYCEVGKRSLAAGRSLKMQGFTVRPLKVGYQDLVKSGFPKATN